MMHGTMSLKWTNVFSYKTAECVHFNLRHQTVALASLEDMNLKKKKKKRRGPGKKSKKKIFKFL